MIKKNEVDNIRDLDQLAPGGFSSNNQEKSFINNVNLSDMLKINEDEKKRIVSGLLNDNRILQSLHNFISTSCNYKVTTQNNVIREMNNMGLKPTREMIRNNK